MLYGRYQSSNTKYCMVRALALLAVTGFQYNFARGSMPVVMASSASSSGSSDLCASLAQVPPKLTQLEDTLSSAGASHMPLVLERLSGR